MNWASSIWLDEMWRAPAFPVWATLIVAGFAALVLLVVLMRGEPSAAGGTLAVIALLAIVVAAVTVLRGTGESRDPGPLAVAAAQPATSLPALACLDELAGDAVQAACERVLFGSPDHVAAAVSYVAAQIGRLTALGKAATAEPEAKALRNAVQRDRYGFAAHVLVTRDGCTPSACAAFQAFTDTSRIVANMNTRAYGDFVSRYMPTWSAAPVAPAVVGGAGASTIVGLPPSAPTGRPTTIDFPTSDSIPPVSIMSGEPTSPAASAAPAAPPAARAPTPQPRPVPPPAKRQSKSPPAAPVQLAPSAPGGDNR